MDRSSHRKTTATISIDSLPPELLALCFGALPAVELGRAARVSRFWLTTVDGWSTAWRQALPELDVFGALRGADVTLTLVKGGDHRLSTPGNLALLRETVLRLAERSEGVSV